MDTSSLINARTNLFR